MLTKLNSNSHISFNKSDKNKNYIAAIAIGSKHFKEWKKFLSFPKAYCKKQNWNFHNQKNFINKKYLLEITNLAKTIDWKIY